jgi:broad specificity phosphatase PhoE/nicotinamide riboside kinase
MVSPVVTHLHLLRHGRVDAGPRRRAYGWTDLPLSVQGQAESALLERFVRTSLPRPSGIISSDLLRCRALAEPLAEALGVPLIVSDQLREQSMGEWEGVAWDDLQAQHDVAVNDYWDDYLNARPPGGESYAELAGRIERWWDTQWDRLEGGRWVMACHIGVIRAIACRLLGLPYSDALRFAPAHASHTHFSVAESGAVLQVLGQTPSLTREQAEQYAAPAVARVKARRIALCGSAGTGKTTLGRRLAARLDLPFIEEGMRHRIEAGLDIHTLSRDEHRGILTDLWTEQLDGEARALRDHGGFVSDRSPLDFAAFALLFHSYNQDFCDRFVPQATGRADQYDAIVILPWGVLPLESDGIRSTNRWYQRHFQSTVEGLIRTEVDPGAAWFLPGLTSLDQRVDWVLQRISGAS